MAALHRGTMAPTAWMEAQGLQVHRALLFPQALRRRMLQAALTAAEAPIRLSWVCATGPTGSTGLGATGSTGALRTQMVHA